MIDRATAGDDTARAVLESWPGPALVLASEPEPTVRWSNPSLRELWGGPVEDPDWVPDLSSTVGGDAIVPLAPGTDSSRPVAVRVDSPGRGAVALVVARRRLPDGSTLVLFLESDTARDRAVELVRTYAPGVVHSVRNQLTVVSSSAFALRRLVERVDPGLASSVGDVLGRAGEGIRIASEQIRAFADFAAPDRDDEGSLPVELGSLVTESLRPLVGNAFVKALIDLEWDPVPESVWLSTSRTDTGLLVLEILRTYLESLPERAVLRVEFPLNVGAPEAHVRFVPSLSTARAVGAAPGPSATEFHRSAEHARRVGARLVVGPDDRWAASPAVEVAFPLRTLGGER
ncbi:MAG: hypothetical protein KDC38_10895 [Planctomycetes bacterium]|nr:hypothetical protein [Planctomycetota bacterium]